MSDDAIKRFVDVTGSSVEDAIKYLSICDNNVSLAVECFVDQQPHSNGSHSNGGTSSLPDVEAVRAPIPSRTDRLVEEQVRVGRVSKRPANAFDAAPGQRDFSSAMYANPLAKRKLNGLAALFKPPSDINFVGTLEKAKIRGKRLKKWLLVNIQDITDFQCQVLNRDLWSKPEVRNMIDQHFVFWQIYRDSMEGEHFLRFYSCPSSPFIGVIDPGTGELMRNWTFLTKEEFISEMTLFLSENFTTLLSPVRSPPSKRPCTNRSRGILNDITESATNSFSTSARPSTSALWHSEEVMRSRSPSPQPGPSSAEPSSSTSEPSSSQPSTRIVNGEIMSSSTTSDSDVPSSRCQVDPAMINITFRFPDGSRDDARLGKSSRCSDLYRWLSGKKYSDHVIWTQFPKAVVPNDSSSLIKCLGCDRVMLYVEERD